jgi:hypothetical protein
MSLVSTLTAGFLMTVAAQTAPSTPQNPQFTFPELPTRTVEFGRRRENVFEVDDLETPISATVYYRVETTIDVSQSTPPNFVTRDVDTRPEAPAPDFTLRPGGPIGSVSKQDKQSQERSIFKIGFAANELGAPNDLFPQVFQNIQRSKRDFERALANQRLPVKPSANVKSGGWTRRIYGLNRDVQQVRVRIVEVQEAPGKQPQEILLEEAFYTIGTYDLLPTQGPMVRESFRPDPIEDDELESVPDRDVEDVLRDVGGIQWDPDQVRGGIDYSYAATINVDPTERTDDFQFDIARYWEYQYKYVPQEEAMDLLSDAGYTLRDFNDLINNGAAEGEGMNYLNYPGRPDQLGDFDCSPKVFLPIGTVWYPSEPGYQRMLSIEPLEYRFLRFASLNAHGLSSVQHRTLCLDVELKEPEEGVKYYPFRNTNPELNQIAGIPLQTGARGPWDQARLWLYMDQSSLETINRRLNPGISEGQYVAALYDLFRLHTLDDEALGNQEIFSPDLLPAITAPASALGWFYNHMSQRFPRELRDWIRDNGSELAQYADRQGGPERLVVMLQPMLGAEDKDLRKQALRWLETAAPLASSFGETGWNLVASLTSDDREEQELALTVLETYRTLPNEFGLNYLAEEGRSDEIKARAQALLGAQS